MLEPQESTKTVATSSHTEEDISCIGTQRYVAGCYCCGKKGHMSSQCCFHNYKCHKCNKIGHLQAVCPGDKNTRMEKQWNEKQQGTQNYTKIQQLQRDEVLNSRVHRTIQRSNSSKEMRY